MTVLTDGEWAALKAAVDAVRSRGRRSMEDERQTVEAVVWRLRNGAQCRAVPPELGSWHRAANLHRRWPVLGVWERAFERLRDAGHVDLAEVVLDGTDVRAHAKAAGAPRGAWPTRSGGPGAGTGRRPSSRATAGAGPSRSGSAGSRATGRTRRRGGGRRSPRPGPSRPAYRRRNRVERLWGRLREWRAAATRYEETAESYLCALHVAASLDWIRQSLT